MTRVNTSRLSARYARLPLSPIIPPSEKVSQTTVRLPDEVWQRLADVARIESDDAKREGRRTVSRDAVIEHFCRWALQRWEDEREAKKKRK